MQTFPLIILFFVTIIPVHAQSMHNKHASVVLSSPVISYEELDQVVKKPFKLDHITYDADVIFDEDEFNYLVDLKPHSTIKPQELKRALATLSKKNKFNKVNLVFAVQKDASVHIHMHLESLWTFKKVRIKGISAGRATYSNMYLIEQGDVFDEKKHELSVEKIKEVFKQKGYCNVQITSNFSYDNVTKSVVVTLNISRGSLFKIQTIIIDVDYHPTEGHNNQLTMNEGAIKDLAHTTFSSLEGKTYDIHEINKCGKELRTTLAREGFLQSSLELSQQTSQENKAITLTIAIRVQQAQKFIFFGNHFFSEQQLFEMITSFGESGFLVPTSILAEEIVQSYHRKGFWNAKVDVRDEEDASYFIIAEGHRIKIHAVEIKGCNTFSEQELLKLHFPKFKKEHFDDADHIKAACDSLILWYQQHGFWDAAIINQTKTLLTETTGAIGIHIDEGTQYFLEHVSVPEFPELMNDINFDELVSLGDPADVASIALQRRYITDYLHRQGFLYVDVKPDTMLRSTPEGNYVSLTWKVNIQSDKVRFGKTIITGASVLPFKYLMRQLHYKDHDLWNKTRLEKSAQQLRELDLFEHVYIHADGNTRLESEKPVVIKLIEDDRFEIRVRAGVLGISKNLTWRDAATYKFGGTFIYKNPLWYGGLVCLDADVTRFEHHLSAFYRHPWINGFPCKSTYKVFSNRYIQPIVIGSKDPLYVASQQGFLASMHLKHWAFTFGLSSGMQFDKTSLKSAAAAQAINFTPSLVDVYIPYFYVEPTLVLDYLNDKLTPTNGSFTVATLKGMFPFNKAKSLLKVLLEESLFFTPRAPITFGLRFRVGHIFNQEFNQITPPERFFLGGPNTLRGYDLDFAPPLGSFIDCGKRKYVPQGGKTMINANFEVRFPIYKYLSGAIFQDAGLLIGDDLVNKFAQAVKNHGVAATGFGLRYNTPIGPLRFDLGFKWKKFKNSDSPVAWYVTLGNAF